MRGAIFVVAALAVPAESLADARAGEKKAQLCLVCHQVSYANAPQSRMPLLEGQPARYLYLQTKAFKEKRRDYYPMQTNAAKLSDRDMRDIAAYFSVRKPLKGSYQLDPAKVSAGEARAGELQCATCHLPSFAAMQEVPRLVGQTPGYLRAQLEAFGSGKRAHGAGQRAAPALALTEHDVEALAQFFASLEQPGR